MKKFLFSALLSAMCVASSQAADVISMNFHEWGAGPTGASPSAGLVSVPYWSDNRMEATRDTGVNDHDSIDDAMFDLNDSNNNPTTMDIYWLAAGSYSANHWGNPGVDADGTQNSQILKSYLDTHGDTTVTLKEVPYAAFDLIVYFGSDATDRAGSITVNGTDTYYFLTAGNTFIAANDHATNPNAKQDYSFVQATARTAAEAIRSNYILIEGLTTTAETVIVTNVPAGGGIAAVQVVDNAFQAYVSPVNEDGTSGSPISLTQAEVTFNWNALADPNYAVDPRIVEHNVLLSLGGVDDPNVYGIGTVAQEHNQDPTLTDPANSFAYSTPLTRGQTYFWQVEQVFNNGDTVLSPLWSFVVVKANATINAVVPAFAAVNAGTDIELEVTGTTIDTYQWFKIGETSDIELANGADYQGVDTAKLTILGTDLADEGKYYCVVSNALPSSASNRDTGAATVYTTRLTSHFTFEAIDGTTIVDTVGDFDITLNKDDGSVETPVDPASVVTGMTELGGNALSFSANTGTTNNGNYGAMVPGVVDFEDITISVWVYRNGGNAWQRVIDCGNDTGHYIFITASNDGGQCRFAINNGGGEAVISTTAVPVDTWTQITATLNGDTGHLYINGEHKASGAMAINPIAFAAKNNYIGKSQYGSDSYFKGVIDELKIYNYARTTEQIALDYLAVKGEWICDREHYNLPYDFDNNCQVDLLDFAAFAKTWMYSYRIYPDAQE